MSERISIPDNTEALSFDLWLTLIKSNGTTFKSLRNDMLRQTFAPSMPLDKFDDMVRGLDKQADALAETRGSDVIFDERLAMIASAAGAEPPSEGQIAELYEKQTALLDRHLPVLLDPKTPAYLEELARAYRLEVISNTGFIHGDQMRGVLKELGIIDYFDELVFSNEVGYAKPHPKVYQTLLARTGLEAENVTHIGDNYRADVEGSRAIGMNAIHFANDVTLESIVATR